MGSGTPGTRPGTPQLAAGPRSSRAEVMKRVDRSASGTRHSSDGGPARRSRSSISPSGLIRRTTEPSHIATQSTLRSTSMLRARRCLDSAETSGIGSPTHRSCRRSPLMTTAATSPRGDQRRSGDQPTPFEMPSPVDDLERAVGSSRKKMPCPVSSSGSACRRSTARARRSPHRPSARGRRDRAHRPRTRTPLGVARLEATLRAQRPPVAVGQAVESPAGRSPR